MAHVYPYKAVHAILLSWEEDDLGVDETVLDLEELFSEDCNFTTTESFQIPSQKPFTSLSSEMHEWIAKYSKTENLLIVFYSGHGALNSIQHLKWDAYRRQPHGSKSPSVDWTALQITLERAEADVLIILNCCCAAGSSNAIEGEFHEGGRTEILASCGYNLTSRGEFTREPPFSSDIRLAEDVTLPSARSERTIQRETTKRRGNLLMRRRVVVFAPPSSLQEDKPGVLTTRDSTHRQVFILLKA